MKSLSDINLTQNPFESLTPTPSKDLIWAGLSELKNKFLKIYEQAFNTDRRKLILNWGKYGSGKTHAAYYFANSRVEGVGDNRLVHLYIRTPKEGKTANQEIIKNIIDSKGVSFWKKNIEDAVGEVGKEKLKPLVFERIQSEEFADAIIKFSDKNLPYTVLSKFIFEGLTAKEMKQLNLARSLKSDTDYVKFLSGLIYVLTLTKENKRVFLWIDEFEDVIHYTSQQYKLVSQILRDLIDTINEKITVFIDMTLAENEQETVKLLLGDALWDRINTKVRLDELSEEEGIEYCRDLIQYYQIEKTNDLTPFSREIIEMILKTIPDIQMTPREINKKFSNLIDLALSENINLLDKQSVENVINKL
jgi:hypothetical protein